MKINTEPVLEEPISITLRRHPQGNKEEIANTVRWVAFSALGIFLTLVVTSILRALYFNALVISIGILPIIYSIFLLRRNAVSVPSSILAVSIILLITFLATVGRGIYDIGVLGYPVILIVAGLILRGRMIFYLTSFVILCMGWLVFGDLLGYYEPLLMAQSSPEDFFIGSVIILVAGNAINRLVKNLYNNLSQAEREIARRKKLENEREELIRQLRSKNQELDRFAVRVSHDLKTPLITVAGFLGFLEKDIESGNMERVGKNISQIDHAAKKMGTLVDEILDLSRVGRIMNPATNVPFEEIVKEALTAAEGILKARQVQVKMDAIFPFVHVDRVRIVQVIQNLVTNSVKFMGDQTNPKIEIGFKETDGKHIFFVRDNGIGIAKEHQDKIFELFNKLDPTTEGTGIGLGLVKRIVEVHGGKIWVESEGLGKGSIFKFTLQ